MQLGGFSKFYLHYSIFVRYIFADISRYNFRPVLCKVVTIVPRLTVATTNPLLLPW